MRSRIGRTLVWKDHADGEKVYRQDEIVLLDRPVVILGDPGLGKSVLAEELGEQPGMKYVRAGKFVVEDDPRSLFADGERPIIDGLDEIASAVPGGALVDVLKQLSRLDDPPFILTCRAADWQGAPDRAGIEDRYGAEPVALHLRPFDEDDARAFLSREFPTIDPTNVLKHLESSGIGSLHGNPLTLRMIGEVARDEGPLPGTRAGLFKRACDVMLKEPNPRHKGDSHVHMTGEELLLATGAICAAQLLCGFVGIHDGPAMDTPRGFVNVAEIEKLLFGTRAKDALRTRLFVAEGEDRFTHVHRVIAEYLGARWLARCFENGVPENRILVLFRQGEGVPTSLRGLHAWMAHFNAVLGRRCIAADPYAVLRYGDAETLTSEQARALLAALQKLSEDNPYFRSEDWDDHPVSGLVRVELRDEILAIIEVPNRHAQLRGLLLEAMAGTALAKELAPALEAIAFDTRRHVQERSAAAAALHTVEMREDWEPVILRLLGMNDPDSVRIAFEFLRRVELFGVSGATSVETVLAYFGLSPAHSPGDEQRELRYVPDSFFGDLDSEQLASWLDAFVESARPLMENANFEAGWYGAMLIRRVTARVLEREPAIQVSRVWNWIGWLDEHRGRDDDTDKRLAAVFGGNQPLRVGILEHVLLTPCSENTWMAGRRLLEMTPDLYPDGEDLAELLRRLRSKAVDGRIDPATWRDLLLLGRIADGLPAVLRDAAVEVAAGDTELLSILDEVSVPRAEEWKVRQAEREAGDEKRRRSVHQAHRHLLGNRSFDVAAGDVDLLELPAAVYLDRSVALDLHYHFDSDIAPEERLSAFLGEELAVRVLEGFMAVLGRNDLPSASRVAEVHRENEHCLAEASMICGVAETIRRGSPLDGIDQDTLAAAYMAWRRGPESDAPRLNWIGSAMEAALFRSEADWEAHFRTGIEPQLDRNLNHPRDLYRLTHEAPFSGLGGRLSVEWLRRYPTLNLHVQTELLACALRNAPSKEVHALLIECRDRAHPDRATGLLWLSADFVLDLKSRRPALLAAAAEDPDLVWLLRDRVAPRIGEPFGWLSLDHHVFIVEAFGLDWSNVPQPAGGTVGDCNPWDASDFIRRTIYAIAKLPSPEATEALQRLIDGHAPSYADTMKHALALQRRIRRDHEYAAPGIDELRAVVANGLPESIDDLRAWFGDRIDTLQKRIRGSDTDMWEAYWNGDRPKEENFCRDRMIEHVSVVLPESIRFGPETRMPKGKRVDIALTRNRMKLPVEIKRQWHREVWKAASDQLDAKYSIDWQAEGRGAYVVLWFGDVPGERLPGHPEGAARPETPEALKLMLTERLPEDRRFAIDVYVMDVSRSDV